jgi:hypothetical protein
VNTATQSATGHLPYRCVTLEGQTLRTVTVREEENSHEIARVRYFLFSTIILFPMVNVQ